MTFANETDPAFQSGVKAERERIFAILCNGCRRGMPVRETRGPAVYRFEHLNHAGIPTTGCDASRVRESSGEGKANER